MARWADDPESAAQALIAGALDELMAIGGQTLGPDPVPRAVLLAEGAPALCTLLEQRKVAVHAWCRRAYSERSATPEPPPGLFDASLLRLPKSREEQRMAVHQCLGALKPDGRLIVYGGNDEGIRSFQKNLAELGPVETIAARGHGRVLQLKRGTVTAPIRPRLADWREAHPGPYGKPWISYPGLFAGGAPDPGTALLLAHLPKIAPQARILDYGCGPGAIAAAIRRVEPTAVLTLLDNDSVALAAAGENVPDATQILSGSLCAISAQKFDLIISNPPLHAGFRDTLEPLLRLIAEAPAHLTASGQLILVVQRRIALDTALAARFGVVGILADDGRYRVWCADKPKQTSK